eukprot:scaffold8641_cov134-Isochrysis_galbana.AAC.14
MASPTATFSPAAGAVSAPPLRCRAARARRTGTSACWTSSWLRIWRCSSTRAPSLAATATPSMTSAQMSGGVTIPSSSRASSRVMGGPPPGPVQGVDEARPRHNHLPRGNEDACEEEAEGHEEHGQRARVGAGGAGADGDEQAERLEGEDGERLPEQREHKGGSVVSDARQPVEQRCVDQEHQQVGQQRQRRGGHEPG